MEQAEFYLFLALGVAGGIIFWLIPTLRKKHSLAECMMKGFIGGFICNSLNQISKTFFDLSPAMMFVQIIIFIIVGYACYTLTKKFFSQFE